MTRTQNKTKISQTQAQDFRGKLLAWYDRHRRELPWRARKGERMDPYRVWLSEIMCQQTTVTAVKPYYTRFLEKWPDVRALAAAEQDEVMQEWAGLGYYARARNLHKCARVVTETLNGEFPGDQVALKALPGIGDYTSAAIAAIAFNEPATVMDGNIERVIARYFAVEDPLPQSKPFLKELTAAFFRDETERPGDLAQAFMDLGAAICIPKAPRCSLCPVSENCKGRQQGVAEKLPVKSKSRARPSKFGYVYWIENTERQVLLHRRPETGLLAGMPGFPTSAWHNKENKNNIKILEFIPNKSLKDIQGGKTSIHHVFTHFDLELVLKTAEVRNDHPVPAGFYWEGIEKINKIGFPSLFKKALKLFQHNRG